MLYLFSGIQRDGDIAWHLREFSKIHDFQLEIDEWDVRREPSSDLSSAQSWDHILHKIRAEHYDVVMLSPPCGSYSRARHRSLGKGGPVPLRSSMYPWGFPWLSASNGAKVQLANFFVKCCLQAIEAQIQANKFWLFEHPEDLGRTQSGDIPASVWQLPEMRALVDMSGCTWAVHQCVYGAETSKPTRLAGNLPACIRHTFRQTVAFIQPCWGLCRSSGLLPPWFASAPSRVQS